MLIPLFTPLLGSVIPLTTLGVEVHTAESCWAWGRLQLIYWPFHWPFGICPHRRRTWTKYVCPWSPLFFPHLDFARVQDSGLGVQAGDGGTSAHPPVSRIEQLKTKTLILFFPPLLPEGKFWVTILNFLEKILRLSGLFLTQHGLFLVFRMLLNLTSTLSKLSRQQEPHIDLTVSVVRSKYF